MRHSGMVSSVNQRVPVLIGSVEAARILGKSPRTVHRLVESGALTPVLTAPGGAGVFMFDRADVEALRDERAEVSA